MKKANLFVLWVALGASPVWAQTEGGLSGVGNDRAGASVADVPVTSRSFDTGGLNKVAMVSSGDYPVRFVATDFHAGDFVWGTPSVPAGLSQARGGAAPAGGPANPDALTWHGITLYGAYDVGLGWVSHGLAGKRL